MLGFFLFQQLGSPVVSHFVADGFDRDDDKDGIDTTQHDIAKTRAHGVEQGLMRQGKYKDLKTHDKNDRYHQTGAKDEAKDAVSTGIKIKREQPVNAVVNEKTLTDRPA